MHSIFFIFIFLQETQLAFVREEIYYLGNSILSTILCVYSEVSPTMVNWAYSQESVDSTVGGTTPVFWWWLEATIRPLSICCSNRSCWRGREWANGKGMWPGEEGLWGEEALAKWLGSVEVDPSERIWEHIKGLLFSTSWDIQKEKRSSGTCESRPSCTQWVGCPYGSPLHMTHNSPSRVLHLPSTMLLHLTALLI